MDSIMTALTSSLPFASYLFQSSADKIQKQRVSCSQITQVETPVHARQHLEKTWTITRDKDDHTQTTTTANEIVNGEGGAGAVAASAVPSSIDGVFLDTPGLTVLRVRPELFDGDKDVMAHVRVTSDKRDPLDSVDVSVTKDHQCHIKYKPNRTKQGHLVTEISVPHAGHMAYVMAYGGGDVVVDGSVFASHGSGASFTTSGSLTTSSGTESQSESSLAMSQVATASASKDISLMAMLGSRLFVDARDADLHCNQLLLGTIGTHSHVHFRARRVTVENDLLCAIIGKGRTDLVTQCLSVARHTQLDLYAGGHFRSVSQKNFTTRGLVGYLKGISTMEVIMAPTAASARSVFQSLRIDGPSWIDVSDVPALSTSVTMANSEGGIVLIDAPKDLQIDCKDSKDKSGVIGYMGTLPLPGGVHFVQAEPSVELAQLPEIPREQLDDEGDAFLPTIKSAFEWPVRLEKPEQSILAAVIRPMLPFWGKKETRQE